MSLLKGLGPANNHGWVRNKSGEAELLKNRRPLHSIFVVRHNCSGQAFTGGTNNLLLQDIEVDSRDLALLLLDFLSTSIILRWSKPLATLWKQCWSEQWFSISIILKRDCKIDKPKAFSLINQSEIQVMLHAGSSHIIVGPFGCWIGVQGNFQF